MRTTIAFAVFALAVVAMASVGLERGQAQPSKMPASQMRSAAPDPTAPSVPRLARPRPQHSQADIARRSRVYARFGEVRVTVGDIEDAIAQQSPFLRDRYRDPAKVRELADSLVRFELLARAAERNGYGDHPSVVRAREQSTVQQLIATEFDERLTPESISDEDVQAYYDGHLETFQRPAMVRASHILFETREEALALLEEAREADNRGFRQLARQHSKDSETKLRGGDLRYFDREGRIPRSRADDPPVDASLVEAAFALEDVGDVAAAPVPVRERWSIVKLTGQRSAQHHGVQESAQGIRARLWRERRQTAIDEFVQTLRAEHPPEVHLERMRGIELAPVEPAKGLPTGPRAQPGPTHTPSSMDPTHTPSSME